MDGNSTTWLLSAFLRVLGTECVLSTRMLKCRHHVQQPVSLGSLLVSVLATLPHEEIIPRKGP